MENRKFKGVWIPKDLWLDKDLSMHEKCLLIEIDSLDNDEKGCDKKKKKILRVNIRNGIKTVYLHAINFKRIALCHLLLIRL
jgi:hypothetical protein